MVDFNFGQIQKLSSDCIALFINFAFFFYVKRENE